MKKVISYILVFSMILSFFSPITVDAATYVGTVTASSGVRVRTGPGTGHSQVDYLISGSRVDLVNTTLHSDQGGCPDGWYEIYYDGTKTGYTCSSYLNVSLEVIYDDKTEPSTEYEKVLKDAGFPSSYWPSLSLLHEKYPTWNFVALDTEMTFDAAVKGQSAPGWNLIQTGYDGYKSTEDWSYNYLTDTFKIFEGSNWYAASSDVISYYLDPRNFLNEESIFMFEKLNYDTSISEDDYKAAINGLLGSSYLTGHINDFMYAGATYDVNPVYLTALAVQESGYSRGTSTSGGNFTYTIDGVTNSFGGVYNIFNIGAYTGTNPVLTGLVYAAGGFYKTGTTYGRAWDTLSKAIIGGSEFISGGYISKGQYTTYLKKFNVNPGQYWDVHTHQYQTNVQAPIGEADKSHNAYNEAGFLNLDFTFEIPVFINMPQETNLPSKGNPNNHLSMITVNGANVVGFVHDSYVYDVYVAKEATSVSIKGNVINEDATLTGSGDIKLSEDETPVELVVTAENGSVQKYTVNIVRTDGIAMSAKDVVDNSTLSTEGSYINGLSLGSSVDHLTSTLQNVSNTVSLTVKTAAGTSKESGTLGTGDMVTITNGKSTDTFTVIITGDNDGDGEITILDLLRVQKDILNYSKLGTYNFEASDIDNNGVVDLMDLLKVQKHILGYSEIK